MDEFDEDEVEEKELKKKQMYDVKVEALVPATFIYKVSSFDEQEALDIVLKGNIKPTSIKYNANKKIKSICVYMYGTIIEKLRKYY